MSKRYNPPPNWPTPPEGWSPPDGWQPDPAWGPPPAGWELWLDDEPKEPKKVGMTGGKLAVLGLSIVLGLGACGAMIGVVGGGDDVEPAAATSEVAKDVSQPATTVTVTAPPVTVTAPPTTVTVTAPAPPPAPTPDADSVVLPDLAGVNGAIAYDKYEALGLENVRYRSTGSGGDMPINMANWTVVSSEPAAGKKVLLTDTVVVTVKRAN